MSDLELTWPNKDLSLRASGENDYVWIEPNDSRLRSPPVFETIGPILSDPGANIIAIGDGLDVLEALTAKKLLVAGGI